ncbi:MAG: hypothetical protein AVDCRST_MAG18-1828 [uncultured Thermomicrobiales bacterium]|uniref:Putative Flp pilus-assembly TadG-like N-terminal domain-containing protein n=1 Tax=uncultured Thermomicrobiales bacterium TaxID=1645740 RepID=A0A6J4V6L2_9BACT|nr:MAG: hypothetical protein AVDCRST_MAG18-1828 [uncultured Thermomicrobiales bacterium]
MNTPARRPPSARRPARGQTLVIFALSSLVLLGALGLSLDGGYNYIQRRGMQNAADAAAFAGASAISRNRTDTEVTRAVLDAAARNGVPDATKITCTFITNTYDGTTIGTTQPCSSGGVAMSSYTANFTGVLVRASERHQTFVFRALGIAESGTAAIAAARVERPIGVTGGPFMVCGINTVVTNANASYAGGIYKTGSDYLATRANNGKYTRDDGRDNCQGGLCPQVPSLTGAPVIDDRAYAYDGASLGPIKDNNVVRVGPVYLIHDPSGSSGINPCNNSSASFKGINTNVITYPGLTFPAYNYDGSQVPPLTTGTVASVAATVEGINGCQVGGAVDNCIMILPVCDASGPGGTGSGATLAVRSLEAFYIKKTASGSHTGQLIKNYTIRANSDPTYVTGGSGVTAIKLIK